MCKICGKKTDEVKTIYGCHFICAAIRHAYLRVAEQKAADLRAAVKLADKMMEQKGKNNA